VASPIARVPIEPAGVATLAELAALVQLGDLRARDALWARCSVFAKQVARRCGGSAVDVDDLSREALLRGRHGVVLMIHRRKTLRCAGRDRALRIVGLCGSLVVCACSSDGTTGAVAGAPATAGAGAAAGANSAAGFGGSSGSPSAAAAGAAGVVSAGMGGATAAAGAPAGGSSAAAGAAGAGTGGAGNGGVAGSAGSGGTGGAMMTDCAGHALSLSANGTGHDSDAAEAYVDIDMMTDLPIGNANRTVELWAYMKAGDWTAGTNTVFFYGSTDRNAPGFGLDFGNTTGGGIGTIDPFTNALFDNDNQSSGVTAATSQWVHFAMTWDGTQVKAYVNGILKSSKTSDNPGQQSTLMTAQSHLAIGAYTQDKAFFADYIDEFRVWKAERTAAQLLSTMKKTLVGNEDGLVGYWKFNEASGTTAADSVTTVGHTAHPGTLTTLANNGGKLPTFAVPDPPAPVSCP
jgi:hypothetical protein